MSDSTLKAGESADGTSERQELITHSGMRFVGKATDLLNGSAGVAVDAALSPTDLIFATHVTVRPMASKAKAVDVILSVLNQALSPKRIGGASLTADNALDERGDKYHRVFWETLSHEGRWAGELTWIHPHLVLGGVGCTTRVAITSGRRPDQAALHVHVGVHGGLGRVRGPVGAGQARPAFLDELNRLAILTFSGEKATIRGLEEHQVDDFVRTVLLSDRREYPVAFLAPVETTSPTDPTEYLVAPEQVARELLGLAHVYVAERHAVTFALSDSMGDKRLSCFRGALRIYQPDFTCADDPMSHPLLLEGRVEDPVARAGLVGLLGAAAATRIPVPEPVRGLREEAAPSPPVPNKPTPQPKKTAATPPRPPSDDEATRPREESVAVAQEGVQEADVLKRAPVRDGITYEQFARVMEGLVGGLDDRFDKMISLQERLIDEVSRLRTATMVRSANAGSVERQLSRLERTIRGQLAAALGPGDEPAEAAPEFDEEELEEGGKETLVSVVQNAESEYGNDLLILDSAVKSAAESPYEDVERVALYLKVMADLARRRQEGRLDTALREAFSEAGIDYRGFISSNTSRQMREQYKAKLPNGREVECAEHIALGNSRDPRYCLRIYFTSKVDDEPRFVIAHIGKHFEIKRTN